MAHEVQIAAERVLRYPQPNGELGEDVVGACGVGSARRVTWEEFFQARSFVWCPLARIYSHEMAPPKGASSDRCVPHTQTQATRSAAPPVSEAV